MADAFPDWYPILQDRRVNFTLQTQSSDKMINSYSNSVVKAGIKLPVLTQQSVL